MKTPPQSWRGHLLAVIAGALVSLSLAPFNHWPLGIVSTAMLAWLLVGLSPLQAAIRGWFYGLGLFGAGASWVYVSIHVYGYASVPLAVFLTALFCAGLGLFTSLPTYCYARWVRDAPLGQSFGFAAIFVLGEWWRSWFLTGFPWLYLGYAHIDSPLAGWAPVTGIYGLSFIVAFTGAAIFYIFTQRRFVPALLASVALLWLTGPALKMMTWATPSNDKPIKVAMVQANISQEIKWNRDQYWPTLDLYQQTSAPLWENYDIVVWPEAAVPGYYQNARRYLANIDKQASQGNATLITGLPYLFPATETEPRRYHNSVMAFGDGSGTYHKQRLVPFGEYVPLEDVLRGLIQFFDLPMSAFSPGSADQAAIKAGDITLAPFICYEIVYPGLVTEWLPDADMLITISNDAWFGQSIGPLQHLQMAQMRALESGRYLLRSTGSGVSAIIDQHGQIVVKGKQFTREIITGEAIAYQGATPFALAGSWPILILCLAIGISSGAIAAKMRR